MPAAPKLSMFQVLACGAAIVTLSMGIRHGFGLWLQPITQAQDWTRETFAFAIAIQNLSWGVFGIFAGMVADRFGAFRVLVAGSLLYALGLAGMALSPTPLVFALTAGVLIGAAQAGTTYAVVYGVIGRQIDPAKRSWAMGVAAAAGSFGQFLMVPVEGFLISGLGWQQALLTLAAMVLLIAPLGLWLREPGFAGTTAPVRDQTIVQALREAARYPSFQLLMAGYFVCGFQVVFIGVHMPSYLKDNGLSPQVASYALALIGLFNVFGTYIAGSLGQRLAKRKILAGIYLGRAVAISLFLWAPLTPTSVYVFSGVMGLLWLSTVPPTNAMVAQIFGVSHLSMLAGFVFLSHQIGSFLGVWLGGFLHDRTGSYDMVWGIAVALGVFAALINLPVREAPIVRAQPHGSSHEATPTQTACVERNYCRPAGGVRALHAARFPGHARGPDLGLFLALPVARRGGRPVRHTARRLSLEMLCTALETASSWVQRWTHLVPSDGVVLDVACGRGRHLRWFSERGHPVVGVDRDAQALRDLTALGRMVDADIENGPWPFAGEQFDGVVVTNYLWRPLLPALVQAVAPGGALVYETFAAGHETVGRPTRPDFLLQPGELLGACAALRIVAFEEGFVDGPPRFVQRIAAVRPTSDKPEPHWRLESQAAR